MNIHLKSGEKFYADEITFEGDNINCHNYNTLSTQIFLASMIERIMDEQTEDNEQSNG